MKSKVLIPKSDMTTLYLSLTKLYRSMEMLQKEVREMVPESILDAGLNGLIQEVCESLHVNYGKTVVCHLPENEDHSVSAGVKVLLYRIMMETVLNILQYADAGQISILLDFIDDKVVLRIEDDGRGFDSSQQIRSGKSLNSMKEQVVATGGFFQLTTAPGKGCRIEVSLSKY